MINVALLCDIAAGRRVMKPNIIRTSHWLLSCMIFTLPWK